ncbi:hypothetical protein WN943_023055 [Citrus x changshan-huyou]
MNALDSSIPSSFGNMNFLQILDLSNNQLTGEILEHLAMGCFNLQFLALSNNSLEDLSYNRLNGSIPDLVDGLSQLSHLILAHNNLEGKVPVQLCRLNQLQLLDLSNNNLHGLIPP